MINREFAELIGSSIRHINGRLAYIPGHLLEVIDGGLNCGRGPGLKSETHIRQGNRLASMETKTRNVQDDIKKVKHNIN